MTYKTLNTSTHTDLAFTHLIVTQQEKNERNEEKNHLIALVFKVFSSHKSIMWIRKNWNKASHLAHFYETIMVPFVIMKLNITSSRLLLKY